MIKLIKEMEKTAQENPMIELKNPALSYYDSEFESTNVFDDDKREILKLNDRP